MKIFAEVQKVGKALMTPVAILPAAGLFLAFGNKLQYPLREQGLISLIGSSDIHLYIG